MNHPSSQEPESTPNFTPSAPLGGAAGFAAPISLQTTKAKELAPLAQQILADPLLLEKCTDRVFALLQADLRQDYERHANYRGRI